MDDIFELQHTGKPHEGMTPHSGRYKWGSGKDKESAKHLLTRCGGIIGAVAELKEHGITNSTDIAKALEMTTTEYRARYSVAYNANEEYSRNKAIRLSKKGWGATAIGRELGRSESTVRGWLTNQEKVRKNIAADIADKLEHSIPKNGAVDIGKSSELFLGTSADKLKVATQMLIDKGYTVKYIYEKQLSGAPRQSTTIKLLCAPGVDVKGENGLYAHRDRIKFLTTDVDNAPKGTSIAWKPPVSIDSKRLKIVYAEDTFAGAKGIQRDGVMLINPKAADLRIPDGKRYAQVRIAVDGTHYLKGVALMGDARTFPKGVDIAFCTNKHKGTPKMDVIKPMEQVKVKGEKTGKIDMDNPFKAVTRQFYYTDPATGKKKQSPLNIVNAEGDWNEWSRNLPSQMLSKQTVKFASQQLGLSFDRTRLEYKQIMDVNNPVIKKKLLMDFANNCDSNAVRLKASAVPGQKTHVILPINSLSEKEIYAPNYTNGTKLALVRFPHGGRFEIPVLVVNNKNREGLKYIGNKSKDAVGINAKVAERLSGADFDGDTVLCIPNNKGLIKNAKPLSGLKGFDPKERYSLPKDISSGDPRLISNKRKQREMGIVSNLITDMTLRGATSDDITKAVRHSMVVIDSEKHKLDYKRSAIDNDITAIKKKYQPRGGASTLISLAKNPSIVEERVLRSVKDGGPIDPKTGKLVYIKTGATHPIYERTPDHKIKIGPDGKPVVKKYVKNTMTMDKMALTDDARTLSSGTQMESIYAGYANGMKAMANKARLEYLKQPPFTYSPAAKKKYAKEVGELVAMLNDAKRNQPLERKASVIANARLKMIKDEHPDYDSDDLKKAGQRELKRVRTELGLTHKDIKITDRQWEAIQAKAISANRLSEIMRYSDLDRLRQLATPRKSDKLPTWSISRAKGMLELGYTNKEVADALGISVSTLDKNL